MVAPRPNPIPALKRRATVDSRSATNTLVASRPYDGSRGFQPTANDRPPVVCRGATIEIFNRRSATVPQTTHFFSYLIPQVLFLVFDTVPIQQRQEFFLEAALLMMFSLVLDILDHFGNV
jgi:hypothetical protein